MKRKILAWIMILVLILATGCTGEVPDIILQTTPTVPDVFTKPTEESTKSTVSEETEPTETTAPIERGHVVSIGACDVQTDETGHYLPYAGGEMHMAFGITADGNMSDCGVGILLFVDGQLQPYKTEDDDTYRYMHTFYPEGRGELVKDLIFVPVAGEEGDVLEIWYTGIYWPEYSYLEDGITGFVLSSAMPEGGTRLRFGATPPELEMLETPDRMISSQISHVDLTASEIAGWSDTDFRENYEYRLYVNGSRSNYIFGITEEEPVRLRFEVWGNPNLHYGLVFFVDNQPVSVVPEDLQFFGVNSGQKTVVEAELDMTGFDGESFIYAALIPRNGRSAEEDMAFWIDVTSYVSLYDVSPFPVME